MRLFKIIYSCEPLSFLGMEISLGVGAKQKARNVKMVIFTLELLIAFLARKIMEINKTKSNYVSVGCEKSGNIEFSRILEGKNP
jgi:hypothetical protein